MKTMPEALADHLSGAATTLCRCWRLTRRDGVVMGFTDHDRDLAFDGLTFEAASGVAPSDLEQTRDLAADSSQIAGALVSNRISDADIGADLYDGAKVEVFLVNWAEPGQRLAEHEYRIGEIAREDGAFRAELRGVNSLLDQTVGRRFSRLCDADLGDARCGFALSGAPWVIAGEVVAVRGDLHLAIACPQPAHRDLFRGGRITFDGGAGAGKSASVAGHVRQGGQEIVALWQPPSFAVAAGDPVRLTAGCDKRFATCRDRFANTLNFRGFPHIPGNDFALGYASTFDEMDGGALIP